MREWLLSLLDLLFPPLCVLCGRSLDPGRVEPGFRWAGHGLCSGCHAAVRWIRPPFCPRCGRPFALVSAEGHLCGDCLLHPPPFDSARSLMVYRDDVVSLFHLMKYGPRPSLARFLGEMMGLAFGGEIRALAPDGIIPIPMHPRRLRQRGFNQASWMARRISRYAGVRVREGILVRTRWVESQVGLSKSQRLRNIRGTFGIGGRKDVGGGRWVIVDDVMTTGATATEAARVLKRAGAVEVHLRIAARVL